MAKIKSLDEGIEVISLFDGMSCGQIALEKEGIKVKKYFASEIEIKAMQITQKNYPNTVQVGDVKELSISKIGGGKTLIC